MSSFVNKHSNAEKVSPDDKNKQWQREFLMDRLRSHHPQHKLNYPDLSKSIRMAMLEKRYALDSVEKSNLQKCLDSMQHCIKVTTRQGLVERLESLSRQLGLKFMEDSSGLFISSDMFFLEIILDAKGMLTDVKVHHECKIEQQSCSELVTCLLRGDFADFTSQLEGLSSIYQLNAEPKVKSKAFVALQAMETDLYNLFKWQSSNKDMPTLLKESPVGIVQKRRGGHPMKLTYFVSSYDLLSLKSKIILPLTMELLKNKDIGMNVTVHLEASSANKLQILPSVTLSKDNNFPIYAPLSQNNSTLLPATFVLRLNEPLPVCKFLLDSIGQTEESGCPPSESILNLTVQVASKGLIKNSSKEFFVSLPDQNHCYFFTENKNMNGTIITSVPFTEPSQVPKILSALKRQALFYTFLASCVRTDGKLCSIANTTMLEVNAISLNKISVALQHSTEDSLVSVEFEFKDTSNINVKLFSVACSTNYETFNQKLTKVAEATLSIPLTIRYLLKLWENEQVQSFFHHCNTDNGKFVLSGSNNDVNPKSGNRCVNFRDNKIKFERNNGNSNDNTNNSDNLFSRPPFFNPSTVPITSSDLLFSDTNLLNTSTSSIANQFGIKTEQIKDFTSSSLQQEDFCKSPKSKILVNSRTKLENSDLYSLGNKNSSSMLSNLTMEKVSNFNKNFNTIKNIKIRGKKSVDTKNTVSIIPVLTDIHDKTVDKQSIDKQSNEKQKRLEIEIFPIVPNVSIPSNVVMSSNNNSTENQQTNVKKKCNEKQSIQYKTDKKRRRRDNSTTNDKIELKLIEFSNSSLTVKNIDSLKKNCNSKSKKRNETYKQSNSTNISNGSAGKPNLITLKTAINSSKCAIRTSEKRQPESNKFNDILLETPFYVSVDSQLGNSKSNETNLKNALENTKILFQNNPENVSIAHKKLKDDENKTYEKDKIKIHNIMENHVNKIYDSNKDCTSKYMIKPSVNGMKLTINKTKSFETLNHEELINNKLSNTFPMSVHSLYDFSAQASNKTHTGLKPGVSSGPASKSKMNGFINNISTTDKVLTKSMNNKSTFHKSYSSESLQLKKDEKNHSSKYMGKNLSKSLSSNSLNTKSQVGNIFEKNKHSPKMLQNHSSNVRSKSVEQSKLNLSNFNEKISQAIKYATDGLIKPLNKNFQIPKLSKKSSESDQFSEKKKDLIYNKKICTPETIFDLPVMNNIQIQSNPINSRVNNFFDESNVYKNIEKDINQSSSLNKISKTTSNEKKIHYADQSDKTQNTLLLKNAIQNNHYSSPSPSLSMHIIKTSVPSTVHLQNSLLNSSNHDVLMDEAFIEIGSK